MSWRANLGILILCFLGIGAAQYPYFSEQVVNNGRHGDFDYYEDGAKSILEFDIGKKFALRHQPILEQRGTLADNEVPSWAKYAFVFYPNPSFKFGYSLTAAALTGLFPQSIFDHYYRLGLVNLFLTCLLGFLIFRIVQILCGHWIPGFFALVFFTFDVSNSHNNYSYQSHTVAGMFFVALAMFLFLKYRPVKPLHLGILAFLLTYAVLSSSHIPLLAMPLGLYFLYHSVRGLKRRKIYPYLVAGLFGTAILPLYIIILEGLFHFHRLMIPRLFAQLGNYQNVIGRLVADIPFFVRFIWDWRVFNFFFPTLIVLALILAGIARWQKVRAPQADHVNRPVAWALFVILIIALVANSLYPLPVSRGTTPFTVYAGVITGAWFGQYFRLKRWWSTLIGVAVLVMVALNYYMLLDIWPKPKYPLNSPINEVAFYNNDTQIYYREFRLGASAALDRARPPITSMSVTDFVKYMEEHGGLKAETEEIRFDPMQLITAYSDKRLFVPSMQRNKVTLLSQYKIMADFRLLFEIFSLQQLKLIKPGTLTTRMVTHRMFGLWDQEYNYVYGFAGGIKEWLKGTSLADVDMTTNYIVDLAQLRESIKNIPPEQLSSLMVLPTPTPAASIPVENWHLSRQIEGSLQTNLIEGLTPKGVYSLHCDANTSHCGSVNSTQFQLEKDKDYLVRVTCRSPKGQSVLFLSAADSLERIKTEYPLVPDEKITQQSFVVSPKETTKYILGLHPAGLVNSTDLEIGKISIETYVGQ